jgi:hypothetical protein
MLFDDDRTEEMVIKSTVKNKKRDEELDLKTDLE